MKWTLFKLNAFLFFKLPSAFWCGVRLKEITTNSCTATVKENWINKNPFNSIYFAVLAMGAELTTGALVLNEINSSKRSISMLVLNSKSSYSKKAKGTILFSCNTIDSIKEAIQKTIASGEGQTVWLKSVGTNKQGVVVTEMDFEWSIKLKA
ncbi:MAG: hypothetical protein RIQ59_658 [Bacteroidota bacterium]|jgi:hypothetical protein